ncbi:MAG: site-2 protease family protein [Vicinamibacteria bacterium]
MVHGDELKALAAKAEVARKEDDSVGERLLWQEAIPLLPVGSKQRLSIETRLAEIDSAPRAESSTPAPEKAPSWASGGGVMGAAALVLWKLKGVLLFGLGKLKFLTLGLSKASTLFSFLASFAVYWSLWGWRYALGFLVAMYIHEMGHVAALRRYGIPASAPMFVPGLGAFVRMDKHPATTGEDARIGLAGPEWGFAAALASYAMYALTAAPIWAAIGYSAAFLNLFNLLPIWQLDGGRGFAALTRGQRLIIAVAFAAGWAITRQGLFGLLFVVAVYRAFADGAENGDLGVVGRFTTLIAVFAAMLLLGRPTP